MFKHVFLFSEVYIKSTNEVDICSSLVFVIQSCIFKSNFNTP